MTAGLVGSAIALTIVSLVLYLARRAWHAPDDDPLPEPDGTPHVDEPLS